VLDSNTSERGVCTASVPSHAFFWGGDGDKGYAASPGLAVWRSMHLCRKITGGASSTSDDALNATGDARRSEEPPRDNQLLYLSIKSWRSAAFLAAAFG
jgi:hypothetical protein